MGFRFRKSFKLAPGVRVNLSKKGAGVSLGGKGLTHSIGPSGRRTSISAPGSGMSFAVQHKKGRGKDRSEGSALLGLLWLIGIVTFLVWLLK
ncbi:DUF4236 domain-containing protein [Microvirga sp. 2YAF29]|uniref:DUF4236 domain-containing protein n=1 Tax=Microvirga sp. 2YAF29 TaxID=3233031 RepID=UPI003F9EA4F4